MRSSRFDLGGGGCCTVCTYAGDAPPTVRATVSYYPVAAGYEAREQNVRNQIPKAKFMLAKMSNNEHDPRFRPVSFSRVSEMQERRSKPRLTNMEHGRFYVFVPKTR